MDFCYICLRITPCRAGGGRADRANPARRRACTAFVGVRIYNKWIGMKRILLLAAVALLSAPLCVQAQRSEITVSYGYAPTSNWSDSFSAIKDLVSDAKTDISGWGAVTVGYNLRLLGPLSIGAQVVCSTNEQKIKGTNTEIRNRYWAVMPNVKWTWLNLKIVSLYSRAAVGAVFSEAESGGESEHATRFAYQVSPVGVTVGGRLAAYAEAGVGASGSLLVGLRYSF